MKVRSIRKEKVFIPEFNGNKDLPEDEQVKIEVKQFPTAIEVSQYKDFGFGTDVTVKIKYNDNMIVTRHAGKIHNLEDDDGKIMSGEQLAKTKNYFFGDLIAEFRDYILDAGEGLTQGES